jgi:hypothetical protein
MHLLAALSKVPEMRKQLKALTRQVEALSQKVDSGQGTADRQTEAA